MTLKHGNFDQLAENYAKYRPDYCEDILTCLLAITGKKSIKAADVGAGTGIWTRMVANSLSVESVDAVEPCDAMRDEGIKHSFPKIQWHQGSGEETNLKADTYDLVTMASSFHWVDFDKGMDEFSRVLKKGGIFAALWNPRYIQDNPILVEIENKIKELNPNVKRVSSGKSTFVEQLTERFLSRSDFSSPLYLEGRHVMKFTKEEYIGAWLSVNDVQFQLGDKFQEFIQFIEEKLDGHREVSATYLTRCWSVRKV